MLTMITNSWRAEHHVLNREGTAALCRKNLTPYEWPTYGPDGKNIGTTTAVYKVAGRDSARFTDAYRVTCLACIRKLGKILDAAYPEAHHLYGDVLNRKALNERAARKAAASGTKSALPLDQVSQDRKDARDATKPTCPSCHGTVRGGGNSAYSGVCEQWPVCSPAVTSRVDDLGRRVQQTASGHWISFPSPVVEPRHEVAEHCGITDSELPATPTASADRLLGRALYFIRELAGITVRHQRSAAEQVTIEQARKFLAEIERGA